MAKKFKKRYVFIVRFDAIEIDVLANNKREAKSKMLKKLNSTRPSRYLDHSGTYPLTEQDND